MNFAAKTGPPVNWSEHGIAPQSGDATLLRMKTITIEDMSARRDEVLANLAHGETFSVLDRGCEVATLLPRRVADGGPAADDAFYRLSDLASKSTDDGAPLSNAEMDRLIYAG